MWLDKEAYPGGERVRMRCAVSENGDYGDGEEGWQLIAMSGICVGIDGQ